MAEVDDDELHINRAYAKSYAKRKEREEKSHLKEKYGFVGQESSSESSEEEDEDAEGWTSDMERGFLRTLSMLKNKDPAIYDSTTISFCESGGDADSKGPGRRDQQRAPVLLKDFERQQLLQKGSMAGQSESEEDGEDISGEEDLTYSQEQNRLRQSFQEAAELENEDNEDGLLVLRQKTDEEKSREEDEYVQWLKGEGGQIAEEMAKDLAPLQKFWTNPGLDEGEKFLRDFILNKAYLEDREDRVPTYQEMVQSDSEDDAREDNAEVVCKDSEDEEALEQQEVFERRFNFRFEEPDADLIMSYPRTLKNSYRREDEKRKMKRKEREERKSREAEERKYEIRRLRELQQREMREKLERLSKITGNSVESFGLSMTDLEGDFDPDSYDGAMQKVFSEDYYEYEQEEVEEKPQFSDLEGEDWDYGDENDFNMDADCTVVEDEVEEPTSKRKRRKRRRGLCLDDGGREEVGDAELLDRYKHEGYLKGEMFRYRQVEPNDFGLSIDEILWSDNKELNRWSSLSKAVQYLTPEEETKEKKKYQKKGSNLQKKKAILTNCYGAEAEAGESELTSRKRKKHSHDGKKSKASGGQGKKKRNESKLARMKKRVKTMSENRLKSYGL